MYCLDCNYCLESLGDGRECPECGKGFDALNPGTYLLERSVEMDGDYWVKIWKGIGLVVLGGGLLWGSYFLFDRDFDNDWTRVFMYLFASLIGWVLIRRGYFIFDGLAEKMGTKFGREFTELLAIVTAFLLVISMICLVFIVFSVVLFVLFVRWDELG